VSVLTFLISVPLLAGLLLLGIKSDALRKLVVAVVTATLAYFSLNLALDLFPGEIKFFQWDIHVVNQVMLVLEAAMAGYILYVAWRFRRPVIGLFMILQTALMAWIELAQARDAELGQHLFVDKFSVIMALINGIVGGLICLYAVGYMKEFHEIHRPETKDRRPLFFGLLFIFLGAMYGIVFSNNLLWLYFFWELTTLCSFLLINYKQTEESQNNALCALTYNLVGGLAFAGGIAWFHLCGNRLELQTLLHAEEQTALLPAALFCFAGITKSAQFPFSRWLLGAMVAPTPVSALLHSSTMVKAGCYLILRMAPLMQGSVAGILVAMVGAVTFLIGSFLAIGTSDAKRVLAYSTVANLGLIVLCGGLGTYEAVWAGLLLIVFHAVAKCLLFLCVGVIEHKLHSRDIEAMDGLILSMPRISVMLQIGIAGMFLAPFGMLISKWAVLKAVIDAYPLLTIFIVFGSAATLLFWVKWLGKLIQVVRPIENVETHIALGEWFALTLLTGITAGTCLCFPFISSMLITPYIVEVFGASVTLHHGNFVIMTIMLAMVMLFPLSFFNYGRKVKVMDAYLGGANLGGSIKFQGSAGRSQNVAMSNYYFADLLNEQQLFRAGVLMGMSLLLFLLIIIWL
jgi:ech hydrogenase subunit A